MAAGLQDGAVAQAFRVLDTLLDDLLCLVCREHVFRQLVFHAAARSRKLDCAGDDSGAPSIERSLDGLQSGVLRAEAEWSWTLVLR